MENMDRNQTLTPVVLHWNYRGFTEFPLQCINGEESEITDIYLKENLISRVPNEICKLENLESLYLSGNDIMELPKEISHLRCLKCLEISGNRLRALPDEIGELRSLKFLILDENELTVLPLRLNELRSLRYLSVCDNKLQWLSQRPVYNYHHCEFRFWRNPGLKTIPYSLWYHMFRDQQTRSLNIGCLNILKGQTANKIGKCRLKLKSEPNGLEVDATCPPQHTVILSSDKHSPPSLYELCKRRLYHNVYNTAKRLTDKVNFLCVWQHIYDHNQVRDLQETLREFNIDKDSLHNGNFCGKNNNTALSDAVIEVDKIGTTDRKSYYATSDVVDQYFICLPQFMRDELRNGPVSRCENSFCKTPVFDYAYYEFCLGKLILIDNVQEIILSAAFCSKSCSEKWKMGKSVIPWSLL